jgi:hypothetical protein
VCGWTDCCSDNTAELYLWGTQFESVQILPIACNDNLITTVHKVKFLGLYICDSLNWSYHIEYIIPELSSACYVTRSIKPFVSPSTLKTVYYSYFNAIISYGLPFWGNSPHATKIFKMQTRIVRIMMGCNNRVSRRNFTVDISIIFYLCFS